METLAHDVGIVAFRFCEIYFHPWRDVLKIILCENARTYRSSRIYRKL